MMAVGQRRTSRKKAQGTVTSMNPPVDRAKLEPLLNLDGLSVLAKLRTKRSVDASLGKRQAVTDTTTFVTYEPGNGKTYEVLLNRLDEGIPGIGIEQLAMCVSLLHEKPIRTMIVQPSPGGFSQTSGQREPLYPHDVAERLGVDMADAIVLAEMICSYTARGRVDIEKYLLERYGK